MAGKSQKRDIGNKIHHQDHNLKVTMLKSKGATYFLLILTLAIWGFIIYKILFVTNESKMAPMLNSKKAIEHDPIPREELVYHTGYPNPFEREIRVAPKQIKKTTAVEKKSVVQKNVKKEDEIQLNGVVISNNARTAYMTINNATVIAQQGDTLLNNYIVTAIRIDSVHIKSKGAARWITKTNY